jgi:hypothetical protein
MPCGALIREAPERTEDGPCGRAVKQHDAAMSAAGRFVYQVVAGQSLQRQVRT